ncbi:hypothetical protein AB0758_48325 [Tolypothrix bouteillei VB521301_2]
MTTFFALGGHSLLATQLVFAHPQDFSGRTAIA